MLPMILCLIATSLAPADSPADFSGLIGVIIASDDPAVQDDLLRGTLEGLVGRPRLAIPAGWAEAYKKLANSPNAAVRDSAAKLALRFGDPAAFAALRNVAGARSASTETRINAIDSLVGVHDKEFAPILQNLLNDPSVRAAAIRGLGVLENVETPAKILAVYSALSPAERADAIATLSTREAFAKTLLASVEQGTVSKHDFTPAALLALNSYPSPAIKSQVQKIWGTLRPTPVEKKAMIAQLHKDLTPAAIAAADRKRGRAIFAKTCATCHTLFDSGGKIGPELTGSQRNNLDYVLSNVVDPSAVVARDYQVNLVSTTDGRLLSGIVKREDERVLVLQTLNELVTIAKNEIEARKPTSDSIMPEGLLKTLKTDEIRDLIGYLGGPGQVPLDSSTAPEGAR